MASYKTKKEIREEVLKDMEAMIFIQDFSKRLLPVIATINEEGTQSEQYEKAKEWVEAIEDVISIVKALTENSKTTVKEYKEAHETMKNLTKIKDDITTYTDILKEETLKLFDNIEEHLCS